MPEAPRAVTGREDSAVGGEPVQLSSLVARGLRFEWYEAVAVVQEVSDLMRGAEAWESDVVPDADHIWLRSNGEITVAPGTGGSAAQSVGALARLLLSLIDEAQMPVQLRLVALSANSPTPPYANAEEFSRAVAYFERPGRPAAIRDLYRRGHALPPEAATRIAARTAPTEQAKQPPPRPRRRVVVVIAAAALVVVAGGVAVWWFLGRPPLTQLSAAGGRASSAVSGGLTAGKDLLVSSATAAWERVTGTQPQPEAPPAAEPARPTVQAARAPGAARPGTARSVEPAASAAQVGSSPTVTELPIPNMPEFRAFDLATAVRPAPGNVAPAPGTPASTPRQPVVDEQLAVPTADFPGPVYTTADQEVIPPRPLHPKLPTVLPSGTRLDALSIMDLLISESGDVLSVRLVPPARDVREAMMLSAAKAWRFAPATRNGRPVPYLKRIWVIMSSSRANPD